MTTTEMRTSNAQAARLRNLARACEARRLPGVAARHRRNAATLAAAALNVALADTLREAQAGPRRTDADCAADLARWEDR